MRRELKWEEDGLGFTIIYICNFRVTGFGSGSGFRVGFFIKPRPNPDPVQVFFFKTHIRPYSLPDLVKSSPLGLGQARYLRVEYKLPFLSISHNRECSPDSRRGQETTPSLLRQLSFLRSRSQVSQDRKDRICTNSSFTQTVTVLLGEPYPSNDGPTHQEVYEQAQGSRENGLMGNWA